MSGQITPVQTKLLRLMTSTGFASNKHISQMNINKLKTSNAYLTKRLIAGGYIGRVLVNTSFGGACRVMYYITKKGAKFIAETDNIEFDSLMFTNYSGGIKKANTDDEVSLIRSDFIHKEQYICFFIELQKYLENTSHLLENFYHYYKLKGNNGTTLELSNKKRFQPDGIFFCEPINRKKPTFAYIVEIHRHSNRKKIIKQLIQHVEAMKNESVKNRFEFDSPYFVLSIFTKENLEAMGGIIKELQTFDEWEYMQRFFMFGNLEEIEKDFYNGFVYFGGEKKPLPPITRNLY